MELTFGIDNAAYFMYILFLCVALSWVFHLWRPTFSARALFFLPPDLVNPWK